MSRRASRFQHLERARESRAPATPGAGAPPQEQARFDALEPAGPGELRAPVASGHAARFEPPPPGALELADAAEDRLPFQRCPRCESDSSAFAGECQQCHAPLDTEEARAVNERLREERRRQAAVEKELLARRAAERARVEDEEREARRKLAELTAREEAARVHDRLSGGAGGWRRGWGWGWDAGQDWAGGPGDRWGDGPGPGGGFDPAPLGVRLLRLIPNPLWRIGVVAAAVALPVLLILFGGVEPGEPGFPWGRGRFAGLLLLSVLLSLFSPRRRWRGRYWR